MRLIEIKWTIKGMYYLKRPCASLRNLRIREFERKTKTRLLSTKYERLSYTLQCINPLFSHTTHSHETKLNDFKLQLSLHWLTLLVWTRHIFSDDLSLDTAISLDQIN